MKGKNILLLIISIGMLSSCSYFEKRKREKEKEARRLRILECSKNYNLASEKPFDEIMIELPQFTFKKQMFVKQNIGNIYGCEVYVNDIIEKGENIYLIGEVGFSNYILLKVLKEQVEQLDLWSFPYLIFKLEKSKLLNIDYSINENSSISIMFIGKLLAVCN